MIKQQDSPHKTENFKHTYPLSDDIGEIIFERTEEVIEKRDDVYQAIEKKKAEYETWSRRYKELLEERISGHNRLLSFKHTYPLI